MKGLGLDNNSYSAESVFGKNIKNFDLKAAKYLKGSRHKMGLSQLELCRKIGNLSQPNLSAMENGNRPVSKEMANRIKNAKNR